jgi:DNA helicase-2/ATP-dependent DNA helicase PcrA
LENAESELISEPENIENGIAEIKETEEEILSPTMYKNNGGNPAKTKDSNKNKLWSKLKKLWS